MTKEELSSIFRFVEYVGRKFNYLDERVIQILNNHEYVSTKEDWAEITNVAPDKRVVYNVCFFDLDTSEVVAIFSNLAAAEQYVNWYNTKATISDKRACFYSMPVDSTKPLINERGESLFRVDYCCDPLSNVSCGLLTEPKEEMFETDENWVWSVIWAKSEKEAIKKTKQKALDAKK